MTEPSKELAVKIAAEAGELAWLVENEGHVWAIRPEMLGNLGTMHAGFAALDVDVAALEALNTPIDLHIIEAEKKSEQPPNLRPSEEDGESCGDCVNYDSGNCELYDFAVEASDVCDDFEAEDEGGASAAARGRGRPPMISGSVASIPLKGVLMPQASLLALIFGLGSGLQSFRSQLRAAANDDSIGAIVLDIDSPGGLVDFIPETAAEVREARKSKPVIAVVNTLAASAAYWIASQAEEIVVTPSGEVGSIGVYAEHQDISKALEARGVTNTLVSAGKYKVEGNPYEPLDDEARQAMQDSVNDYYNLFVKDVASGRNDSVTDVRGGYGEGRVLTAKRAVDAKLADRIATMEEVVAGLLKRSRSAPASASRLALPGAEVEAPAYSAEDRMRVFDLLEAGTLTARKEVV